MTLNHLEAAAEMLDAIDKFMSGKPLTGEQSELQDRVFKAGIYAAAAYDAHMPKSGGEGYTLTRTFLMALIDPLNEDLDYLRRDPAACAPARDARKQTSN